MKGERPAGFFSPSLACDMRTDALLARMPAVLLLSLWVCSGGDSGEASLVVCEKVDYVELAWVADAEDWTDSAESSNVRHGRNQLAGVRAGARQQRAVEQSGSRRCKDAPDAACRRIASAMGSELSVARSMQSRALKPGPRDSR